MSQAQQPLVNPFRKPGGARPVYAKVGIFAESGGGKTHFALNAPKPAIVDPESGTEWFRGQTGFGDWEVMQNLFGDVVDQVHYALTYLEHGFERETVYDPVLKNTIERLTHRRIMHKDEASGVMYPVHDRETFVMDPITLIWDQIQFEQATKIARSREDFVHKDWGEMKRDYKSLLNRFIQLPMHVIVLARHAYEKDQDTGKVTGERMDAEKSTIYSFDLAFQLVEKNSRRDAIIYKDRSN
ncbi:MAG: AAA family ATPase, partial [Dehalococcoidia bacterium]|nr:AAA family ATPase [Dehalococcoidia bacterium]